MPGTTFRLSDVFSGVHEGTPGKPFGTDTRGSEALDKGTTASVRDIRPYHVSKPDLAGIDTWRFSARPEFCHRLRLQRSLFTDDDSPDNRKPH